MNKRLIYGLILIVLTCTTGYIVLTSQELTALPDLLKRIHRGYLILAILLMVGYLLINAKIIQMIGNNINAHFNFRKAFFLSMVGQYYSLITPFASGGQPAQVYLMKAKYNIPYTKGTTIMLKKFIIFQVVVSSYALGMFMLKFNLIFEKQKEILLFLYIGLLINIIGAVAIIILFYNKAIIKKILNVCLGILRRLKLLKRFDQERFFRHIDEYAQIIDEIKNNIGMMIKLLFATFVQLTMYFSITYFIYLSLGYGKADYLDILAIQTVLYVVVSFIPTPGGAGASESGFYILFSTYFTKDVLLYAMLLWRLIIYYGNLILSGSIVIIDSILHKTKVKPLK